MHWLGWMWLFTKWGEISQWFFELLGVNPLQLPLKKVDSLSKVPGMYSSSAYWGKRFVRFSEAESGMSNSLGRQNDKVELELSVYGNYRLYDKKKVVRFLKSKLECYRSISASLIVQPNFIKNLANLITKKVT